MLTQIDWRFEINSIIIIIPYILLSMSVSVHDIIYMVIGIKCLVLAKSIIYRENNYEFQEIS